MLSGKRKGCKVYADVVPRLKKKRHTVICDTDINEFLYAY